MPDDDLWPGYPCTNSLFDPSVPAPCSFWSILARSASHMNEPIEVVTKRAIREGLLEHRPAEGSA
jgi:hypothetical protein